MRRALANSCGMQQRFELPDPRRDYKASPGLMDWRGPDRDIVDDALAAVVAWFGCSIIDLLVPMLESRLATHNYHKARRLVAWAAFRIGNASNASIADLFRAKPATVYTWVHTVDGCRGRQHFFACEEFVRQVMGSRATMRELAAARPAR